MIKPIEEHMKEIERVKDELKNPKTAYYRRKDLLKYLKRLNNELNLYRRLRNESSI